MEIKNLFHEEIYNDTVKRINRLRPGSERKWGIMSVDQMMAHLVKVVGVPLSEKPLPRILLGRLVGWAVKSRLYNETPFRQGLPTSPSFKITDQRDFELEKKRLLENIAQFYEAGPEYAARHPHPMFGRLTGEQWGKATWKHVDHHLRQFGN